VKKRFPTDYACVGEGDLLFFFFLFLGGEGWGFLFSTSNRLFFSLFPFFSGNWEEELVLFFSFSSSFAGD